MQFHGQSLKFINTYYFQAKNHEDDKASTIYIIIFLTPFMIFPLALLVLILVFINMGMMYTFVEWIKKSDNDLVNSSSLLMTSISVNVTLFTFHIMTIIEYSIYNKEVFELDSEQEEGVAIFRSVFAVVVVPSSFLISCCFNLTDTYNGDRHIRACLVSLTINILYFGCYFLPYILFAFIYNPFQIIFFYLALAILIVCIYLSTIPFTFFCKSNDSDFCVARSYCTLLFAIPVVYFVVVILIILAIGSFTHFMDLQYLLFVLIQNIGPITLVTLSYFVLQLYKNL